MLVADLVLSVFLVHFVIELVFEFAEISQLLVKFSLSQLTVARFTLAHSQFIDGGRKPNQPNFDVGSSASSLLCIIIDNNNNINGDNTFRHFDRKPPTLTYIHTHTQ